MDFLIHSMSKLTVKENLFHTAFYQILERIDGPIVCSECRNDFATIIGIQMCSGTDTVLEFHVLCDFCGYNMYTPAQEEIRDHGYIGFLLMI